MKGLIIVKQTEYDAVIAVCSSYYDSKKRSHCSQVEQYLCDDPRMWFLDEEDQWLARAVAFAHDLIEDTDCTYDELLKDVHGEFDRAELETCIRLLTHIKKKESYYTYVRKICESGHPIAIMVKCADMKDHLRRQETLTEKLRLKYAQVTPLLLRA